MKKLDFWRADWFLSLVVALVVLAFSGRDLIQSLERKAYDLGVQTASRTPSDKIAVIAIDDQSIANIGRWPWSREVHAKMTDILVEAKAKVIVNSTFFFEPQLDPGLGYINKLLEVYKNLPQLASGGTPPAELAPIGDLLGEAEQRLNTDRTLAASFRRAGDVLVPMVFQSLSEPQGAPDPKKPLPEYLVKNSLKLSGGDQQTLPGDFPLYPIPELGEATLGIGHLNAKNDVDGAVRAESLLIRHHDKYFPSLALLTAAKSLNLQASDIKPLLGEGVQLGKLNIRTDSELRMYTFFYSDRDGRPAFPVDSFFDVLEKKVPASKYQDKIVLIGATAAGLGTSQVTPISPSTPPVLTMAHSVSSLLSEHFFVVPWWGALVEKAVFLLVALYLILLLPRLKAAVAGMLSLGIGVALIAAHFVLMVTQLMWLQLMGAVVLLAVGYAALITKRFLVTERGKEKSDLDSAQSNRMLGLAYQGQGQLDTALDYFRKLPIDDGIMDLLYNLGLDFERKRQFNKAESVFRYMADYNPKFRDLDSRLNRAKAMSETVILGGAGGGHPGGTVMLPGGGVEKPMLGRYQVEKELGKGAMGVVYLGKDPKIGRVVAIKTMALSQEFDPDELKDVKERFFREAETAGRLTHPNIVTIYDAGEEHDLAYIAMEFLKGKDLTPYVKPDKLLPLDKVLSIVARVAEALAYAHKNNVVHRDIKPANVMYELESDTVKVTDFGIARITDSSKTKTGMVLGTPSYMSPEQLSGQKIEGRSDLFSLGVALYQMASGHLPFQGESMAQLMFKIANEAHADIRTHNPKLPACVAATVNKALAKDPDQRYQDGEQMAKAVRLCLQSLSATANPGSDAAGSGNELTRNVPMINLKTALEVATATHPGMVRSHNEDSIAADAEVGLAVLADGMGGYNAGEVASGIAVELIRTEMKKVLSDKKPEDLDGNSAEQLLTEHSTRANAAIFHASQSQPQYSGMGTTLVVALWHDNQISVGHIGDSRLYRLRGGKLDQVTRDHSLLQEQIDSGMITKEQARHSQNKNLVTRAVGIDPEVETEVHSYPVQPGDIYLMCSDGLNDMVTDEDIEATLSSLAANLPLAAQQLVQQACDNGGRDNVSVILVRIVREFPARTGLMNKLKSWFK